MAIKKVGYKLPRSMAGVLGTGAMEMGGIPLDPKIFIIGVVVLIVLINLINILLTYFLLQ